MPAELPVVEGEHGPSPRPDATREPTDEPAPLSAPTEGQPVEPPATMPPETSVPTERPTPRTELSATDPTTVQLAAGQVQLVELFAFW